MHPDNVQTLGGSGSGPSFPSGQDVMADAEFAAVAALEEAQGCCRGTCAPRLEKGDAIDAAMEAGVEEELAAAAESGADALVADARERRKRLHWYSSRRAAQRLACC
jgi:hypothetical protein